MPKGGGALAGIGEQFRISPATGTASMSVPVAMSPGRAGFGPSLSLVYDSGAGNGPFGLGWSLDLPSIVRKTRSGLPRYRDSLESDVFLLDGTGELVPSIQADGEPEVVEQAEYCRFEGHDYQVTRYRPRLEQTFARVEKWIRRSDGDIHWRRISGDHVTDLFGASPEARVHWPGDASRTFRWLLERSFDDKGHIVVYRYRPETAEEITPALHETRRLADAAFAQVYPDRVLYGNSLPYLIHRARSDPALFDEPAWWRTNRWYFQLVFDYGDHDGESPRPEAVRPWPARPDPFSTFRSGFEIRTYRLCRRLLMFHQFGDEPLLVRSTDLTYDGPDGRGNAVASQLAEVGHTWYEPGLPPAPSPGIRFGYSQARTSDELRSIDRQQVHALPDGARSHWVDLAGEGLSGILSQRSGAWFYQRNRGDGGFEAPEPVTSMPSLAGAAMGSRFDDVDASGTFGWVTTATGLAGSQQVGRDEHWQPFVPFEELPNLDFEDPNLRLFDITGDGLPDLVLTDDDCVRFYRSMGTRGYAASEAVAGALEEDGGPAVVFADSDQSIQTADMSGDGLTDIVRIRSGEICYWPNRGYGSFGPKVTMSDAPRLGASFDPRRVRLGDVDGSGTADLIYLDDGAALVWTNQAGNRWSAQRRIEPFPPADELASVRILDLLGRGTGCLVWTGSSVDAESPIRYLELMAAGKPYLLESIDNGMGVRTTITYAPSTKFYLADRRRGRPWITKLPFPVQVAERVETHDQIRGNRFVSRTSYHHGAYDGREREFRGFGRVEQWQTEDYEAYLGEAAISVPPVHAKTWFHTGCCSGRRAVSRQFADEYYAGDSAAWALPDTSLPAGLDAEQRRGAIRALQGRELRTELYAQDGSDRQLHPYAVTEHSYRIRLEQGRAGKSDAVFFVSEGESLTHHYERDPSDPRISHTQVLEVDPYGRPICSSTIAYPRREPEIPEQAQARVVIAEASFIDLDSTPFTYRLGLPHESKSYELEGLEPAGPWTVAGLAAVLDPAARTDPRRLLGRQILRYFGDDLDSSNPLPFGLAGALGLVFESYRLAFSAEILGQAELGGRITPERLAACGYRNDIDGDDTWWIPSGHPVFPRHAAESFYLPSEARDPFGAVSRVVYDPAFLFPVHSFDALGNESRAEIDYRVLAPRLVTEPNGNQVRVVHDTRAKVMAVAVMGKDEPGAPVEGDRLDDYRRQPESVETDLAGAVLSEPRRFLQNATAFFYYDLFAWRRQRQPPSTVALMRETRVSDEHGTPSRIRRHVVYSDGFGRTVLEKSEAEPGDAPYYDADGRPVVASDGMAATRPTSGRWIGHGATVFDHKGHPVRRFEPFFDSRPDFTRDTALVALAVSSTWRYDALERRVRSELPDGTFERVEFGAWHQVDHDASDTVLESDWLTAVTDTLPRSERAQAELHARTPTRTFGDVLGRPVVSVAHNKRRIRRRDGGFDIVDEWIPTRTELDIEGRPMAVYDGRRCEGLGLTAALSHRGNRVMRYAYAHDGQTLYRHSMDGGETWELADVLGNPVHLWDGRDLHQVLDYDQLRRPVRRRVESAEGRQITERIVYGESLERSAARSRNLLGRIALHFDGAGLLTNERVDMAGNVLEVRRTLPAAFVEVPEWSSLEGLDAAAMAATPLLEAESHLTRTSYDALGRAVTVSTPDGSRQRRTYGVRGALESLRAGLRGAAETVFVTAIERNARGQRTRIAYGNGVETTYAYDPASFRLAHLESVDPRGQKLQDLHYRYDAAGNLVEVRDEAIEPVFFRNEDVRAESRYVYDSLHRLVEAGGRESAASGRPAGPHDLEIHPHIPAHDGALRHYTQHYDYDPAGNLLSVRHIARGGSWTRVYDHAEDSNRLLATGRPGGLSEGRYPHDAAGNMVSMPHLGELHWDHENRLMRADLGPDDALYCHYDASGQRLRKVRMEQGRRTERVYSGDFEIFRRYSGSRVAESLETLHLKGDAERFCMVETRVDGAAPAVSRQRFQLSNQLGSATVELDESARPITYEEYHPLGTAAFRANNGEPIAVSAKRYRHTGMERDEETGLAYHTARYYAPWLGRWISADPVGLVDGTNRFTYVSSPVQTADRSGTIDTEKFRRTVRAIVALSLSAPVPSSASPSPPGSVESEPGPPAPADAPTEGFETEEAVEEVERRRRRRRRSSGGSSDDRRRPSRPRRTRQRSPRVTRGGGPRTRHRLSGATSVEVLLVILGIFAVGTAVAQAPTDEARLAILQQAAAGVAASALVARATPPSWRGGLGLASLVIEAVQIPGDVPIDSQRARAAAWMAHVAQVTERLAGALQRLESTIESLSETQRFLEIFDSQIPGVMERAEAERETLVGDLARISAEIREQTSLLTRSDIRDVREELLRRGVDRDLVRAMLR